MNFSALNLQTGPVPIVIVTVLFLLLLVVLEIPSLNANSIDTDKRPRSVASDLVYTNVPMSLSWDARLK